MPSEPPWWCGLKTEPDVQVIKFDETDFDDNKEPTHEEWVELGFEDGKPDDYDDFKLDAITQCMDCGAFVQGEVSAKEVTHHRTCKPGAAKHYEEN